MIKDTDVIESLQQTFEKLKNDFSKKDVSDFEHNKNFEDLKKENIEKKKFYAYLETIFEERYNQVEYFINNFEENEFISTFTDNYYKISGEKKDPKTDKVLSMLLSDFVAFLDDYFYEELEAFDFSDIEDNFQEVEFIKDNIKGLDNPKYMFDNFFDEGLEVILEEYDFKGAFKDIEKQVK